MYAPNAALPVLDAPPAPGQPAPDFTLRDQNRADWTLSNALNKGDVVLAFFPFAFTGVCGTEMDCITREMARWTAAGAQLVGVSCDSPAALKAWADQMGYKHTLLSDLHRTVSKGYGLYWAEMNTSWRGTVIVERDPSGSPRVKWTQKRELKQAMDFNDIMRQLE